MTLCDCLAHWVIYEQRLILQVKNKSRLLPPLLYWSPMTAQRSITTLDQNEPHNQHQKNVTGKTMNARVSAYNHLPAALQDKLDICQLNEFSLLFEARQPTTMAQLIEWVQEYRFYFYPCLHRYGVIVFRGFRGVDVAAFNRLVQSGLGMTPWNAFNTRRMPGFIASALRRYSEHLLGAGDYRRYLSQSAVKLGPVESSIQGPHVEGGVASERSRYLTLFCEEPAPYLAETAMADLHLAYLKLTPKLKHRYGQAWNQFYYLPACRLKWYDRILLRFSPFTIQQAAGQQTGQERLVLKPSPLVIRSPEMQQPCLQPWQFARNTHKQAYAAAREVYTDRGELQPDSTATGVNLHWNLADREGNPLPWSDDEKQALFEQLYRDAYFMEWQKGDIAILDNIRIGHWRMNGEQGNRKLIQIQTNAFNADPLWMGHS